MSFESFFHELQYELDKSRPASWEVDWDDAPLPYKLYRRLPVFNLAIDVPLALEGRDSFEKNPMASELGHLLWYAFGLTGWSETFKRFVPSGGSLYPNELYIYLSIDDLPHGIYHYDVAHHRLVLLREGNFDSYINEAMGHRLNMSSCFATVFVTTVFWKNYFKYYHLSYRLQGLDAGALIGQLLQVSSRYRMTSGVYYQFLDRAINHLLGLTQCEESVYAVIPLSIKQDNGWLSTEPIANDLMISASELSKELPVINHECNVRSRNILKSPVITRVNEASFIENSSAITRLVQVSTTSGKGALLALPESQGWMYDFADACRRRYSPGVHFMYRSITKEQLAILFFESSSACSHVSDVTGSQDGGIPHISLYASTQGVQGLPDGLYSYHHSIHSLSIIEEIDMRSMMQDGMSYHNVNLFQVPICLHLAGSSDLLRGTLGWRGYRILQMEAGIYLQSLLLTSAGLGMNGHPLLGFDTETCDKVYHLASQGHTALIQVPIGFSRPHSHLQGPLHA